MASEKSFKEVFLYFIAQKSGLDPTDPAVMLSGWETHDFYEVSAVIPLKEYGHVTCGGKDFHTLLVLRSFLRYAPTSDAMAYDLYSCIMSNSDARDHFLRLLTFTDGTLGVNGQPTMQSKLLPNDNKTWYFVAMRLEVSRHISAAIKTWVGKYIYDLLIGCK